MAMNRGATGTDPPACLGLGIDAGGTQTRWALATAQGDIVAEGRVRGLTALQVRLDDCEPLRETLAALAQAVLAVGKPARVHAGLTGFSDNADTLRPLIAQPLGLDSQAVTVGTDIETAYLDLFAPGEGYIVYAGTGSIAAFIDTSGALHRAGGRGVTLDDGGGGYWIAREAMRHIWRAEDECPGAWRDSLMAKEIFALVGGSDWARSREYVYGGDRGGFGLLALAVARAADTDPVARAILCAAGVELARLGKALTGRYGPRPIAFAGRVTELHPLIAQSMREALPAGTNLSVRSCRGHHAAARIAARAASDASANPASRRGKRR
jgi:N-acetylglucosamine kinase-like BadF-type ATPase